MLARRLEPEVMDSPEEARDYDAMDHSHVNRVFVTDFLAVWNGHNPILDVGAGTVAPPPSEITATMAPTGATSPAGTRISASTPVVVAGKIVENQRLGGVERAKQLGAILACRSVSQSVQCPGKLLLLLSREVAAVLVAQFVDGSTVPQ